MNELQQISDFEYYKLDGEREERELQRNPHGVTPDKITYDILKAILRGEKEPGANV